MSDESRRAYQLLEESDTDAISEMLEEHSVKKNVRSSTEKISPEMTTASLPMRAKAQKHQVTSIPAKA